MKTVIAVFALGVAIFVGERSFSGEAEALITQRHDDLVITRGQYCSATATTLFQACQHQTMDDFIETDSTEESAVDT